MPNTPEVEMLRSAETAVLNALANGDPQRLAAIAESLPTIPAPILLTAICNLSDLGKIIPATTDGFLFYSLASASERESAPMPAPALISVASVSEASPSEDPRHG
jgi:hypothetical protein